MKLPPAWFYVKALEGYTMEPLRIGAAAPETLDAIPTGLHHGGGLSAVAPRRS